MKRKGRLLLVLGLLFLVQVGGVVWSQVTERVSEDTTGSDADSGSSNPSTSSDGRCPKGGIFPKGVCNCLRKLSSETARPLTGKLSPLNTPFNPGPILVAVLSLRWQAEQFCLKTKAPSAAGPSDTPAAGALVP